MNRLSNFTTLGVGGPAQKIVHAHSEDELIQFVQAADEANEPVLILGGGSNLLISDAGFAGTVIRVESKGNALIESRVIELKDLPFEFMLNALRLTDGVATKLFEERTGLPLGVISKGLDEASKKGLLDPNPAVLKGTTQGLRYLNNLQEIFLG